MNYRVIGKLLLLIGLVIISINMGACAANQKFGPEAEGLGNQDALLREPLRDPPSYGVFRDSLEFYEQKLGYKFYRNSKGRFSPYASSTWKNFSIADKLNACIYDVEMRNLIGYRSLEGKYKYIIEMNIQEVTCGIAAPNPDPLAVDRVTLMEGSVVTPTIRDQMNRSINFCSAEKYLQDVLQLPWKIRVRGEGLEQAVARNAEEVLNPVDITYGDIVFFTKYYGERNVAIYVGYGAIVYNSCFRADARRMTPDINYRVYRVYSGFNLTKYQVNEEVFMKEFIGRPD